MPALAAVPRNFRRETLAIHGSVVGRDGEQYRETRSDGRDGLVRDVHGGGAHPLDDRAHAAGPCLVQHPGIVAANDGFDLARGEMPGREHRHALFERQPRDEGHLAEAVTVLEQEWLAVDIDALAAIGGCGGHAVSMEKRPRSRPQVLFEKQRQRWEWRKLVAGQTGVVRHDIGGGSALARCRQVRAQREDHESQNNGGNQSPAKWCHLCLPSIPPPFGGLSAPRGVGYPPASLRTLNRKGQAKTRRLSVSSVT